MARPPRASDDGNPVPAPLIGSFLLETITTGMYGERRNAIREYVQNSFDGIQSAVRDKVLKPGKGKISLTVDGSDDFVIHDNGIGLPYRVAVGTLTAVGASRKEFGRQAGFRGIGRLAGIAFCNTLKFRTKAAGDKLETTVMFDCKALRKGMLTSGLKPAAELISSCAMWKQKPVAEVDDHFFEVSLIGLTNAPAEATDALQLNDFLSQVAPVDFHPDFSGFRKQILDKAAEEKFAEQRPAPDADAAGATAFHADEGTVLDRIPFESVAVVVRSGDPLVERPVYKPYRPVMTALKKDAPVSEITFHRAGSTGAWWGWIGHKKTPGLYSETKVAGIRFRLKNIQIDGNELIREVPVTNDGRATFANWSGWFVGEIHVDPRAVVPNARRDNFEEDSRWLAIRSEISKICVDLTAEARRVSDEHQVSFEMVEKKVNKLRENYLKVTRAKTFDLAKVRKLVTDTDKVQKDIETSSAGAAAAEQLRLKSLAKEVTKIRVTLLEKPKTPEYAQYRDAIRQEFLEKTLAVLNNYLELELYDEIKTALEKALR
jgi:hypothetical protein